MMEVEISQSSILVIYKLPAAHDESLLLKHFSASLSGVAFTWYTRLDQ